MDNSFTFRRLKDVQHAIVITQIDLIVCKAIFFVLRDELVEFRRGGCQIDSGYGVAPVESEADYASADAAVATCYEELHGGDKMGAAS